jgi:hypothetical protein
MISILPTLVQKNVKIRLNFTALVQFGAVAGFIGTLARKCSTKGGTQALFYDEIRGC